MWRKDRLVFQHNMVFYFTVIDCWEISGGQGSCILSLIGSLGGGGEDRERLITHRSHNHEIAVLSNWTRHRGGDAIPFLRKECFLSVLLSSSAVSSWKDHLWMVKWVHQSQLLFLSFFAPIAAVLLKRPFVKDWRSRCSSNIVNHFLGRGYFILNWSNTTFCVESSSTADPNILGSWETHTKVVFYTYPFKNDVRGGRTDNVDEMIHRRNGCKMASWSGVNQRRPRRGD